MYRVQGIILGLIIISNTAITCMTNDRAALQIPNLWLMEKVRDFPISCVIISFSSIQNCLLNEF